MKKIFTLTVVLAFLSINAIAQTSLPKGTWALGGTFNLNSKFNDVVGTGGIDRESNGEFEISPAASYFLLDNLSVGLSLAIGSQASTTEYSNNTKDETSLGLFGFGLQTRYHWFQGDVLSFFAQADVQFVSGSGTTKFASGGEADVSVGTTTSAFRPGIIFFPSPKLGIEATMGGLVYESGTTKIGSAPELKSGEFGLKYDFSAVNFGLKYYLGR